VGFQSFNLALGGTSGGGGGGASTQQDAKASVRAVATANITLSGAQTVDGVALVAGDRVLVAGQTTASQNGIYVVGTPWVRADDADAAAEVTAGLMVPVAEGSTYADTLWQLTTNDPISVGSSALAFSLIAGVNLAAQVAAKANRRLSPRQITGTSGTLAQGDEDIGVESTNAGATTVQAPQLLAGTQIPILQAGTGQITITAGSGVTLRAPLGVKSLQQFSWISLYWRTATEVIVSGQTVV
jgi:phage-related tail fiber protein